VALTLSKESRNHNVVSGLDFLILTTEFVTLD